MRIVKRPPHAPYVQTPSWLPGIDSREHEELPSGSSGVYSTAKDLAVFAQMFCNGGSYGRARILTRPAVAAMTRNQIPSIRALRRAIYRNEGSYGYGCAVVANEKWKYIEGSLPPIGTFGHIGAGGCAVWVDFANEIVGVYFSVEICIAPLYEHVWNFDLFQNAVTAAVAD
jgi:CubicO group peptidase (beta-lactamase class C family)